MAEKYYHIYEIKFSKPQMKFLILHLQELQEGRYPEKPLERDPKPGEPAPPQNYNVEIPSKERRYREPAQNRVLELAAEVEIRLSLVMDYISGWQRPDKRIRRNGRKSDEF